MRPIAGQSPESERPAPLRTLHFRLFVVHTVPLLCVVILAFLLASKRRIEDLEGRQIAIAESLVHALTQDLRRIQLFDDHSLHADLGTLLASFPEIEYLVVRDASEARIFYYGRSGLPVLRDVPPTREGATVAGDRLHLLRRLSLATRSPDEAWETVYLRQDVSDLSRQARDDRFRILILGWTLVALALLGSWVTHRVLVRPIDHLAALSRRVAETQDYSERTHLDRGDEVGALARGLDHLLERITRELASRDENAMEREKLISELEARNIELERINYSISHDLKNPLVTIRSFVGVLRRDLELGRRERILGDLERIALAADKMGRLFDDLLAISRPRRLDGGLGAIDLEPLVETVLADLAEPLRERAPRLVVAEDMPTVLADPLQLREVFRELIENAVLFSPEQPSIEIGAQLEGDWVVVHIRDQGMGIEPDYHQRIFALFERLDPSHQGTGAGLTIVRRVVEAHGGRVWVESEGLGRGSTFFFSLPQPGSGDTAGSTVPGAQR